MYDASQGFFFYDQSIQLGRAAFRRWKDLLGDGARVVQVEPGLVDKAGLFRSLAAGLALPEYFGHNWDALEECLRDETAIGSAGVALVHDALAGLPPKDFEIYVGVLATSADHWRAAGRSSFVQSAFPVAIESGVRAAVAMEQQRALEREAQRQEMRQRRLSRND